MYETEHSRLARLSFSFSKAELSDTQAKQCNPEFWLEAKEVEKIIALLEVKYAVVVLCFVQWKGSHAMLIASKKRKEN